MLSVTGFKFVGNLVPKINFLRVLNLCFHQVTAAALSYLEQVLQHCSEYFEEWHMLYDLITGQNLLVS